MILNNMEYLYLRTIDSTNNELKNLLKQDQIPEFFAVRTSYQTAGRGQTGNTWESQDSKNLLFSFFIQPEEIAVDKQFVISEMISLAIVESIRKITRKNFNPQLLKIKWPNDIYYGDQKLGGILIENSLKGNKIMTSVIGCGINVNQKIFTSDAPNPVSISNITGLPTRKVLLMDNIISIFKDIYFNSSENKIHQQYLENLYRLQEWHQFRNEAGEFTAKIIEVKSDGALVLETKSAEIRNYYFKEIEFVINP